MVRGVGLLLVTMLLSVPAVATGQALEDFDYENLSFRGAGFGIGFIWPTKVESTEVYSIRLDLGYLGPGVRIAPSLSYWSSTMRASELDRLAERLNRLDALENRGVAITAADLGEIDWSDLSASLDAHYVWTMPSELLTYLGLGIGLHALNGQGTAIADTFIEDLLDSLTPGLALMGGLEYAILERVRLFAELRYTLLSDVQYPGLQIGGALMLPQPLGQGGAAGPADGGGRR